MKAKDLGYIAACTAFISVSAWISFPIGGIPITLQTLAVCLSAAILGWKRAMFSVLAYLALGAVGIPVFSGFTGGVGRLLSPTGGYLFGFLPLSFCVGYASEQSFSKDRVFLVGAFAFLGLLLCYTIGTLWFVWTAADGAVAGFWGALTACVLPYLPFDCVKVVFALILSARVKKYIK